MAYLDRIVSVDITTYQYYGDAYGITDIGWVDAKGKCMAMAGKKN